VKVCHSAHAPEALYDDPRACEQLNDVNGWHGGPPIKPQTGLAGDEQKGPEAGCDV
jgi:hypothetical protein